jgi:hypothetical protein
VSIGIQKPNTGICIPASVISVRYRTKKCRTTPFYSGVGLTPALVVLFSPVPDLPDAGQSGIPTLGWIRNFSKCRQIFFLWRNFCFQYMKIPGNLGNILQKCNEIVRKCANSANFRIHPIRRLRLRIRNLFYLIIHGDRWT